MLTMDMIDKEIKEAEKNYEIVKDCDDKELVGFYFGFLVALKDLKRKMA